MCDFSALFDTFDAEGNVEAPEQTQARWNAELDKLTAEVQAYATETDMPGRLVANHEVGGLEFYSLETGNFMGVIYVPGNEGDPLTVQVEGSQPWPVSSWHEGIGELVMGYLANVNPVAALELLLGI